MGPVTEVRTPAAQVVTVSAVTRSRGLDVLRGCAVALVMLRHAWPEWFATAGIVGVVLFFALSGFLITRLLDREIVQTGRIDFARFYRNRVLRLAPALIVVVVVFSAVELTLNRLGDRGILSDSVALALTYTADLPIGHLSPGLSHLWTLAVEEQFYIVWPIVLLMLHRAGRLMALMPALIVGAWLFVLATVLAASNVSVLYPLPTTWAIALLIGSAGYLYRDGLARLICGRTGAALVLASVVALAALSATPSTKSDQTLYLAIGPAVACCGVILTFRLADMHIPVGVRPIERLGRISYAVYLWNYPFVLWISHGTGRLTFDQGVVAIVFSVLAATASWHLVELPAMKRKVPARQRVETVQPVVNVTEAMTT